MKKLILTITASLMFFMSTFVSAQTGGTIVDSSFYAQWERVLYYENGTAIGDNLKEYVLYYKVDGGAAQSLIVPGFNTTKTLTIPTELGVIVSIEIYLTARDIGDVESEVTTSHIFTFIPTGDGTGVPVTLKPSTPTGLTVSAYCEPNCDIVIQ